ncbi:MAG: 3-phosphoshikimate 1-carboxyvinyltransferase [Alphaproteobacteria bacterium]|uniref:3-phosphoshikimate 1-carboxyvinyltransferase n=1 Tax=Candidatus Nitrobium versatile TaxID=2884831 RepID=A0A953J5J4_9BACT|nr:3-phosphoshikimate 1-carboxyvinyltransferase [Candidatus Nitrobium versatile]
MELHKTGSLKGEITPPPDKSLSHRAVMFASLAEGTSRVRNFLRAEDPLSTMRAFRSLGIGISEEPGGEVPGGEVIIHGKGLHGLQESFDVIDCGNSGTTVRLLSGILAGNPFFSVLTGDNSLKQRPMARVVAPLKSMGADISGRAGDKYLPLAIRGGELKAVEYVMPVASAQVKSCLILAGLYAEGTTVITEPFRSRDHTERILAAMGAEISVEGLTVRVNGQPPGGGRRALQALDITVPADFSSAAFFMAASLIVPGSEVLVKGVGINPTRTGLLDVLRQMGGCVALRNEREVSGEPVADIHCTAADGLRAVTVGEESIPSLIDEFPILCILATQAEGTTEIRGAEELRVKESDRIRAMASELKKMGVGLEEFPDGIAIKGKTKLKGCPVESYDDHRIAMSLAVAALIAEGTTTIGNASCVDISFPGFFEQLRSLST